MNPTTTARDQIVPLLFFYKDGFEIKSPTKFDMYLKTFLKNPKKIREEMGAFHQLHKVLQLKSLSYFKTKLDFTIILY